jgi:hypothetical protein
MDSRHAAKNIRCSVIEGVTKRSSYGSLLHIFFISLRVNSYTQFTYKIVKYFWTGKPYACRATATMAAYCVVSGLD